MISRISLSILALFIGGFATYGLISAGIIEPLSIGKLYLWERTALLVVLGVPVVGWLVIFFRSPD